MTSGGISQRTILNRLAIIDELLDVVRSLPLDDKEAFFADQRNIWTTESCLRKSLEALMDIGRHILAKGFAVAYAEYRDVARHLGQEGVLNKDESEILFEMGGYLNRMVHFYHAIEPQELFELGNELLPDIELVQSGFQRWLAENPDRVDKGL